MKNFVKKHVAFATEVAIVLLVSKGIEKALTKK